MANHEPSILGNVVPDTSGNVFAEQLDVKGTNDLYDHLVWIFNDTATKLSLHGRFQVPQNYVGTASIVILWTSTIITATNVVWDFDYRAIGGDDAESLDQATHQESVTVTDAAPTAGMNRLRATVNLTSGNLLAGDTVEFILSRDGADTVNDTMVGAAILEDALFRYADA